MSDAGELVTLLVRFLTEPTFSIPLLLAAWALVAWVSWTPLRGEAPPWFRPTWSEPGAEMVSRMYYALSDRSYARVLGVAAEAVDAATVRAYGVSAYRLPWPLRRAVRRGIWDAPRIGSTVRRLAQAHARAVEREGRFRIRWRFWLSPAEEERRFLRRVEAALADARALVDRLELPA